MTRPGFRTRKKPTKAQAKAKEDGVATARTREEAAVRAHMARKIEEGYRPPEIREMEAPPESEAELVDLWWEIFNREPELGPMDEARAAELAEKMREILK